MGRWAEQGAWRGGAASGVGGRRVRWVGGGWRGAVVGEAGGGVVGGRVFCMTCHLSQQTFR